MALAEDGALLEDEPYADWALRPREALELVRQRARLELARDRARGQGRSTPEAVITKRGRTAWPTTLRPKRCCFLINAGLLSARPDPGQCR